MQLKNVRLRTTGLRTTNKLPFVNTSSEFRLAHSVAPNPAAQAEMSFKAFFGGCFGTISAAAASNHHCRNTQEGDLPVPKAAQVTNEATQEGK